MAFTQFAALAVSVTQGWCISVTFTQECVRGTRRHKVTQPYAARMEHRVTMLVTEQVLSNALFFKSSCSTAQHASGKWEHSN